MIKTEKEFESIKIVPRKNLMLNQHIEYAIQCNEATLFYDVEIERIYFSNSYRDYGERVIKNNFNEMLERFIPDGFEKRYIRAVESYISYEMRMHGKPNVTYEMGVYCMIPTTDEDIKDKLEIVEYQIKENTVVL